jgi:hypothetical protein
MKPEINDTKFGSITVDGKEYSHDIIIRLSGEVEKRKKKLSKEKYGTSHKISLEEAKHIFEEGACQLIIGSGQTGCVELSDDAAQFFSDEDCKAQLLPTQKAILDWNDAEGQTIGMFHVTC